MKAMILSSANCDLQLVEVPTPVPQDNQVLLRVSACGVCRTDLHILDGDLPNPNIPLILGHEIIGVVVKRGKKVERFQIGQRLGVPWLGATCKHCHYCKTDHENLCDHADFTGYTINGGYAEYTVANQEYCFPIPKKYSDAEAAPLLCAGLIGYRALKAASDAYILGIYGFGAAAHIITQVAHYQNKKVYAFTKPGDIQTQQFALKMGATWAGDSGSPPPRKMDAAIIFAPVGLLIPEALRHTNKAGIVVCAGIHMSNIPEFAYDILWGERKICSIANLTRRDGEEFLALASNMDIKTEITKFKLSAANEALKKLRSGKMIGAAVLMIK